MILRALCRKKGGGSIFKIQNKITIRSSSVACLPNTLNYQGGRRGTAISLFQDLAIIANLNRNGCNFPVELFSESWQYIYAGEPY